MNSRRRFVVAASGTAAIASLGSAPAWGWGLASVWAGRRPVNLQGRMRFMGLTSELFELRDAQGGFGVLQLIEVQTRPRRSGVDQFSLQLRGVGQAARDSGLYRLEHAYTGAFDVWLEATGADGLGPLYRADFCLLA